MLIKAQSTLGKKVRHYIKWKYSDNRSCCYILVDKNNALQVETRCHKKDHYPERVRNAYRLRTSLKETINQYDMNDVWNKRRDKLFSV